MGVLIVLEGLDGSGKTTQFERLCQRLGAEGVDYRAVSFPDYDSDSSALIKMYLSGEFGEKPGDVNCYAASLFYTVDRFASFKTKWKDYYDGGGTVIAARYTTSNAIHQLAKLPEGEWDGFLDWLEDTEYGKVGIPKPDLCLLLDVPVEVSERLMTGRYAGDEGKKDIHERDEKYQQRCRKAARYAAERLGWRIIDCTEEGEMRPIGDISDVIYENVIKIVRAED